MYPQGLGHTFFFTLFDLLAIIYENMNEANCLVFKFEESINTNTHKS